MAASMCAFAGEAEAPAADMPNSVQECKSADELVQKGGIPVDAPEGAEDVKYSVIVSAEEGQEMIEQVEFTLDGVRYCYRAMSTDKLDILAPAGDENTPDNEIADILNGDKECIAKDIAGMYFKWENCGTASISERKAVWACNNDKEGMIAWLDVVPGIVYSISMSEKASAEQLIKVAEACFVPAQGEVDADAPAAE